MTYHPVVDDYCAQVDRNSCVQAVPKETTLLSDIANLREDLSTIHLFHERVLTALRGSRVACENECAGNAPEEGFLGEVAAVIRAAKSEADKIKSREKELFECLLRLGVNI